ncbi:MAG: hypothetical protein KC656_31395, partial [Myxococcales bacterium]|nr:hypothetical protein [Myxococcales bacterium]
PEAVPTDVPAPPTPVQLVATPPDPGLLLVPQRTTVHLEGTEWVVRDPDGEVVVRFPDGEAPPPVDPQRVDTDVLHEELRRAREESLPDRTLRRLETLLEKP